MLPHFIDIYLNFKKCVSVKTVHWTAQICHSNNMELAQFWIYCQAAKAVPVDTCDHFWHLFIMSQCYGNCDEIKIMHL